MTAELIPLSVLGLDLPEPVDGWMRELERRSIPLVEDDLGRAAITRQAARTLFAEHRSQQERMAAKRELLEQRAIEADQAFRRSLPKGVPVDAIPTGLTAAELLMLSDPMREGRRESVLEHALSHPDGAIVFHSIESHSRAEVGGAS